MNTTTTLPDAVAGAAPDGPRPSTATTTITVTEAVTTPRCDAAARWGLGPWLTVAAAGDLIDVSARTIERLAAAGGGFPAVRVVQLPGTTRAATRLVPTDEFLAWVDRQRPDTAGPSTRRAGGPAAADSDLPAIFRATTKRGVR